MINSNVGITQPARQFFIISYEGEEYSIADIVVNPPILFIYMFSLERAVKLSKNEIIDLSRKGLGREFYDLLETHAKKNNINEIVGELTDDFNDSEGFWKRMGFKLIKVNSKSWKDLRKKLAACNYKSLIADFGKYSDDYPESFSDFIYKKIK